MKKVIFDIETAGVDFESLDKISQEYFLKFADNEAKIKEAKDSLSFYPLTAQIVAIGMLEAETENGAIYFQDPTNKLQKSSKEKIEFLPLSEKEILENFWKKIKTYDQFITFNGRSFDCPFILIRSAINKIRPTRNLLPYRYDAKIHIDLMDQLMFYGASQKRFSLHMWCKAFGIKSSKESGVSGYEVKDLFKNGRVLEIAQYCLADLIATKELYSYWEKFLKF
jgi:uncharacterized protein YprB with RNaseH-like and TPR domain